MRTILINVQSIFKDKISSADLTDMRLISEFNKGFWYMLLCVNSPIKMKPVDVKSNTLVDFGTENNDKDPKFEIGDHLRISKYKTIFSKGHVLNWSEQAVVVKKDKQKCSILFQNQIATAK